MCWGCRGSAVVGEQLWGPREMLDSSNQIWQVKGELQPAGIWTISWAKVVLKLTPGVSVRLNTRVLLKQKKSNVFEDMSGRESALPVWESLAYERARSLLIVAPACLKSPSISKSHSLQVSCYHPCLQKHANFTETF